MNMKSYGYFSSSYLIGIDISQVKLMNFTFDKYSILTFA